jgi:predicted RNA methylase
MQLPRAARTLDLLREYQRVCVFSSVVSSVLMTYDIIFLVTTIRTTATTATKPTTATTTAAADRL